MPKRKRNGDDEEKVDATAESLDYRQQRRIVSAVTDASAELAKAFKTARGFERQKLGRRKKNAVAQKDEEDVRRIDSEVAALKALDMVSCAQHYTHKSLLKIKRVATSTQLPSLLKTSTAVPSDSASLNVNARLCNSNPVKQIFPKLIGKLKNEIGIEDDIAAPSKKRRLRAKDFEKLKPTAETNGDSGTNSNIDELPSAKRAVHREDSAQFEDSDSDEDLDMYDGRVASSGDEDDDLDLDQASDVEDLERQLEQEGISRASPNSKSRKSNRVADLSLSDDDSEDEVIAKSKKPAITKSAFMPSLTTGYISGSASDLDDEIDIAPKKNRRGQRARQQIWEQKYGKSAKHLQKQPQGAAWDPKRGAVDNTSKWSRGGQRPNKFAKGANMEKLGKVRHDPGQATKKPSNKDDSGPLHPSWEAAKRAKEKKNVPVAFQGKKISFD